LRLHSSGRWAAESWQDASFSGEDLESGESLAIVNEQFARTFGEPPSIVGRSLTADRWPAMRIVGVVSGMRYAGPAYAPTPQVFRLTRAPGALTFVVRVAGLARDRIATVSDSVALTAWTPGTVGNM
jgi:hypothetical protein